MWERGLFRNILWVEKHSLPLEEFEPSHPAISEQCWLFSLGKLEVCHAARHYSHEGNNRPVSGFGLKQTSWFTRKVWLSKPLSQPCDTVCHMSDYNSELSCPSELLSRTELSASHWSSRGLASERTYTTLATLWLNPNFRGWSSVNYSIVLSLNVMILRQNLNTRKHLTVHNSRCGKLREDCKESINKLKCH